MSDIEYINGLYNLFMNKRNKYAMDEKMSHENLNWFIESLKKIENPKKGGIKKPNTKVDQNPSVFRLIIIWIICLLLFTFMMYPILFTIWMCLMVFTIWMRPILDTTSFVYNLVVSNISHEM